MASFRTLYDTLANGFQDIGTKLGRKDYSLPETRINIAKFGDPFAPCFKWFVDFSKPYGLFADETYTDSALAYLKRIGNGNDDIRYNMLKIFIENFKNTLKYFDFLFLEVEGLDSILNCPMEQVYIEKESKLSFKMRETIDMRFATLISMYRKIAYDAERMVEVLPANLRRFDCYIAVYPMGYWQTALYGMMMENQGTEKQQNYQPLTLKQAIDRSNADSKSTIDFSRYVLPSMDKLHDDILHDDNGIFNKAAFSNFNNMMFEIQDCTFSIEESGKDWVAGISNEMNGDITKTSLGFNFRFADYSVTSNNMLGGNDGLLMLAAAQNRAASSVQMLTANNNKQSGKTSGWKALGEDLKQGFKDGWEAVKESGKSVIEQQVTPIGNVYSRLNGEFIKNTMKKTADLGISKVQDRLYNATAGRIERLIKDNTRIDIVHAFDKVEMAAYAKLPKSKRGESGAEIPQFESGTKVQVNKGLTVDTTAENIYNRKGF